MKFATKLIWRRPPHLRDVATIPWEIKYSIFCRYSADMEENANKLHLIASNFVIRPQILIFSVLKNGMYFSILITNKIFRVTVLSVIYFCGQFVAPEMRHSRRHCCVCQQSTWYSATRTRFVLNVCIWRGTQQRGLQTHFLRNAAQSVMLISCCKRCGTQAQFTGGQKFKFLISQGSVATSLRWCG